MSRERRRRQTTLKPFKRAALWSMARLSVTRSRYGTGATASAAILTKQCGLLCTEGDAVSLHSLDRSGTSSPGRRSGYYPSGQIHDRTAWRACLALGGQPRQGLTGQAPRGRQPHLVRNCARDRATSPEAAGSGRAEVKPASCSVRLAYASRR